MFLDLESRLRRGTPPDLPTRDMQDRVFAKLTWQLTPTQTLMIAYHNDHWRLPSTITVSAPHEASSMNKGHNPTPTATWHVLLNDRTTFELRYGGFYNWSSSQGLTEDLTTSGVFDQGTSTSSVNVRTFSFSSNSPRLTTISTKMTRAITLGGQMHDARIGAQFQDGGNMSESVWPGGRQVTLNNGQPLFIEARDPSFSGGAMRTLGLFVDDGWSLNDRIKLNLGVRFDLNKGWIQDMPKLDAARTQTGSKRFTAMVDVINMLNADTPLTLTSETVTSVNFGVADTRFDPRRAMVGVRVEF